MQHAYVAKSVVFVFSYYNVNFFVFLGTSLYAAIFLKKEYCLFA